MIICQVCKAKFSTQQSYASHWANFTDEEHFNFLEEQKTITLNYSKEKLSAKKISEKEDVYLSSPAISSILMKHCAEKECPVCGQLCNKTTGLSSHLFKQKDAKHKNYIKEIEKDALRAYHKYENITSIAERWGIGTSYVRGVWRQQPDYKKHGRKLLSIASKRNWENGTAGNPNIFNIKSRKEDVLKIKDLFNSETPVENIAKQFNMDETTVKKIFKNYYTEKQIKKRNLKIKSNAIKLGWKGLTKQKIHRRQQEFDLLHEKVKQLTPKILSLYTSDLTLHEVGEKLGIHYNHVKQVWRDNNLDSTRKFVKAKRAKIRAQKRYEKLMKGRPNEFDNKILSYWDKMNSAEDVAKIFNLYKPNSPSKLNDHFVRAVFRLFLTNKQKQIRKDNMKQLGIKRSIKGGEFAMERGSKGEIYLYHLLKKRFKNAKHHELELYKNKEYDIRVNYKGKIYLIEVSGPHHYESIFGEKKFKKTIKSDRAKKTFALNKGCNYIIVKNFINFRNKSSKTYFQSKVSQITTLIKSGQKINTEI